MKINEQWFVISDLHFGHKMLCELTKRPENYSELIIEGWNSRVSKHDNILILGDLTFVNKEKTIIYCNQLKGNKYLIRGNHDEAGDSWYRDCGLTVIEPIYKRFKDKYDNYKTVLFTHEPVQDLPDGWFNIHGHLHGDIHRGERPTDRHLDVSVEAVNYIPKHIYEVLK